MIEELEKLAHELNLPKLSMERNIYSIQVKDNKIIAGASRNIHHANSIHISYNEKVILEYISIKKPKYNIETGILAPFSKDIVKRIEGSVEEIREYLYNSFKFH